MLRLAAGMRDVIFPVRGEVRLVSWRYLTRLIILPVVAAALWVIGAELFGVTLYVPASVPTFFAALAGGLLLAMMLLFQVRMTYDAQRAKKTRPAEDGRVRLLLDETVTGMLWSAVVSLAMMFGTALLAAVVVGAPLATPVAAALVLVTVHFMGCLTHVVAATLTSYQALRR